jgi:hypothetical protein
MTDTSQALPPAPVARRPWLSIASVVVAVFSIFGGVFAAVAAVALGYLGRSSEPSVRVTSTIGLAIGWASLAYHGVVVAWGIIIAVAFSQADWHF